MLVSGGGVILKFLNARSMLDQTAARAVVVSTPPSRPDCSFPSSRFCCFVLLLLLPLQILLKSSLTKRLVSSSPSSTTSKLSWLAHLENRTTPNAFANWSTRPIQMSLLFFCGPPPADGFSRSDEAGDDGGLVDEEKTTEVTRRRSFRGRSSSTCRDVRGGQEWLLVFLVVVPFFRLSSSALRDIFFFFKVRVVGKRTSLLCCFLARTLHGRSSGRGQRRTQK